MDKEWGHLKRYYSRWGRIDGGAFTIPEEASIIINTPFDGDITSTTGPSPTFTRNLVRNYASSKTTLTQAASGSPCIPATIFGSTSSAVRGIELVGETENLLLHSEDFENAVWTSIGSNTMKNNGDIDPSGGTGTSTFDFSATGDGVEQITSLTSDNSGFPLATKTFIFSVFLKAPDDCIVNISIADTVDATLTKTIACRVTTYWQRFEVFGSFPSTTTGNISCQIRVVLGSSPIVHGAQLQRAGNTGGSNMRARACAGPYVPTTTTTKFCNTEVLTYPFATVDNARAEGSISMWIRPGRDGSNMNEGNITSYFSVGSEQFALYDSNCAAAFWMTNDVYKAFGMGFRTGAWNHVVVTWKDSTNERSVIVNGQIYVDSTTAFATWTAGLDFYLGQHSGTPQYWSSFAVFSDFYMWTKKLTNAQAIQIYNGQYATYEETYDTGALFEVDLGVSIAPTVFGNSVACYDGSLMPTSYSGTGVAQIPYYSDATTYAGLQTFDTPALPASPPLNSATNKGMVFCGNNKNWILQSCAPATTWTAVGAPVILDAVGNAFGANMPYGTITGIATNGIKQSIAIAAADASFVASAWVKVAAGTLACKIHIEGSSGGTPQTTTTSFTANTTWTLVKVFKTFTGAATGNVQMRIELDAAGTLQISGMSLERRNGSQTYNIEAPGTFIKTTTAVVETLPNYLWYKTAGNINPKAGTAIIWAWLDCDSADINNSDGPNLISVIGDHGQYVFDLHYVSDNINFSFGGDISNVATFHQPGVLKNVWYQYAVTWTMDNVGNATIALYLDSTLLDTVTITGGLLPGWARMLIGGGMMAQLATDHWKGGIGKVFTYGTVDSSLITSNWNSHRGNYGR